MPTEAANIIVTVDTECDDQWRVEKRTSVTLENIREILRLQELLDDFGVRPVYLITYPVSCDPECISLLGSILKDGRCEIGAHLHAWTTPPLSEHEMRSHAYLHSIPSATQREKFKILDASIADHFGVKPRSYRGGRWSLDGNMLSLLEEFEYTVDTSVTPGLYWRDGGPDFRAAKLYPYFPAYNNVCGPGKSKILEVPVSIGFPCKYMSFLEWAVLYSPPELHLEGLMRRLHVLRRVWLEPSLTTTAEMIVLCDYLLSENVPVLNIMFHSSELMPGGSPYQLTQVAVDGFFRRLQEVLYYLIYDRGLESVTLSEFASRWKGDGADRLSAGGE